MDQSPVSSRSYIKVLGITIGVLIVIGVGVHYVDLFILGRIPVVVLSSSPLSSAVSKSLVSSTGSVPVVGKNFSIQSIHYFENNSWAVVNVTPIKNDANNATVVVHEQNGRYTTVLGPGSEFSADTLPALPGPVLFYLNSQGMINNGQ